MKKVEIKFRMLGSFTVNGLLSIILSCFVLQGCEKEEFASDNITNYFDSTSKSVSIDKNDWKQQLNYLTNSDIKLSTK